MWCSLIKCYWRVSIFKETPENTPYSVFLLGLAAVCFFLLIVFQWMIADLDHAFTLGLSFLAGGSLLASYGLYTFALMAATRLKTRIVQTLTCLLVGHTLVHLVAFPLLLITPWLATAKLVAPLALFLGVAYLVLTLVLTVWQFMITVHIYKHALTTSYFSAVLASFGLMACNILVVSFWQ